MSEVTGCKRATRWYVGVLLAAAGGPLVALAIFNRLVDPLALFGDPDSTRPESLHQHRLVKPHGLARRDDLDLVILGSSRMEVGFDPASAAVTALGRGYNASLTDAGISELARLTEHAVALHGRLHLLVGLDFYTFQLPATVKAGWSDDRLAIGPRGGFQPLHRWADLGRLLCSLDGTLRSWRTLDLLDTPPFPGERGFRHHGHQDRIGPYVAAHGGARGAFRHKELGELLQRGAAFLRALQMPDQVAGAWAQFDRLLELAARHDLRLDLILPPVHARFLLLLDHLAEGADRTLATLRGRPGWPGDPWVPDWGVASWKRRLVRHLHRVRSRHPGCRIRLWDCMTVNRYTNAALVPAGTAHRMPYHPEPSHFSPAVGDAIVRILAAAPDDGEGDGDFCLPLEPATVEEHLARERRRLEDWSRAHPADAAELAADWRLVCEDPAAAWRELARR